MKRVRQRVAFLAAAAVAAVAVYFSYNLAAIGLDPYTVFWRREVVPYGMFAPDQTRFHKTEALIVRGGRFDAVLLSNSRGMMTDARAVDRATGRRLFNFAVSADYPLGYELKAKWLTQTRPNVDDYVIMTWIDEFQMAGTNWSNLLAREHYALTGESAWSYYWAFTRLPSYDFRKPVNYWLLGLAGRERDSRPVPTGAVDPENGNLTTLGLFAEFLDMGAAARAAHDAKRKDDDPAVFRGRNHVIPLERYHLVADPLRAPLQRLQMVALTGAVAAVRAAGKRVRCVVPPMNAKIVAMIPRETYLGWMREVLAVCGGAWDFSMPSAVTRDDFFYLDWSHFVPPIANAAIAKVLGGRPDGAMDIPSDFGKFVTMQSFEAHARAFREALAAVARPSLVRE